jgi:DNA replicative helicase MCM subunit Mcm2 (Cdc46/Mcm family)
MTMNVSQAKQAESCRNVTVTGMITSYSTSYKVVSKSEWECHNLTCNLQGSETYTPPLLTPIEKYDNTRGFDPACPKCKSSTFTVNHTYHSVRSIQLEDVDKTAEEESIDRLEVVLYDDTASHVAAGERVEIAGDVYIQRKSDSGGSGGKSNKKLVTVLHGNQIRYKNKEKVVITHKDVEIFYKHKRICEEAYRRELEAAARLNDGALTEAGHKIIPMKYMDRLAAMFAPNVIGHNDVKLGLLRSLVGGRTDHGDDNGRRGRIPTLLIGDKSDKGTAKSLIAREATKLIPNSRFVNAQNTNGKSLIGVVDKENDGGLFLRLGPVVLAKGAICAINEIGSMAMQDQGHNRY